ncbi:MAG: TAXI family TRAP transporter solute-binding subunit [Burkholderiaceae bacterium]
MRRFVLSRTAALLCTCLVASAASAQSAAPRSYVLATATTGGTYYPVGVAIATLIKVKLQNSKKIDMSAISSAGSTENIKLLRENQAQFAILQGLVAQFAGSGSGAFKSEGVQKNLRGITPLWFNYDQFVVHKKFATTGRISDLNNLAGQKYSMGARGSGLETMHLWVFPNLGIDYTKFDLVYQGYGPSGESLQNGTISGANFEAGLPTGALTQAMARAGNDLTILSFTDEDVKKANGDASLLTLKTIPANTYPNQPNPVQTAALPNFLAVNADVPDDDVYEVTKAIFENLPFLNNIHAATKEIDIKLAPTGHPYPLHPGAIRYFKEKGLDIPANLIPK